MKISLINTSCRDCVFARYDGYSQTDCRLGRLKKFVAIGAKVTPKFDIDPKWLEAQKEKVREHNNAVAIAELNKTGPPPPLPEPDWSEAPLAPDGKEFFHIEGRVCMACRNKNTAWVDQYEPHQWEAQVREEIRIRMHAVVPVLKGSKLVDVIKTVDSLEKQKLPPRTVHVVLGSLEISRSELLKELKKLGPALVFKIVVLGYNLGPGSGVVSAEECIDEAVKLLKQEECNFYSVFYPGYVVPEDFVSSIDRAINEDLMQILMLEPTESGQGAVFSQRTHLKVQGNMPAEHDPEDGSPIVQCNTLADKIRLMTKDQQHLIKKATDLCPTLG